MKLDSMMLNRGEVLFNRYSIIKKLGEGNYSYVYLAMDISIKKYFIIKEFFPHEFVNRKNNNKIFLKNTLIPSKIHQYNYLKLLFEKEAENLKTINTSKHPGISNFISFHNNTNNSSYIITDYVKTISLQTYLKKLKSPNQLIKLANELLLTLKHIHHFNIYHQDIKIENIRIKEDKTPLIIDFGASPIIYDSTLGQYFHTASPDSAALEQLSLNYPPDINSTTDIYAVAVLLYKILTNHYPINSKTRETIINQGNHDPYIPLISKKLLCFNKQTLKAIDKALSLYPEDRYSTTEEFRKALNRKTIKLPFFN